MNGIIWIHQARARTSWYSLEETRKVELRATWSRLDALAAAKGATRVGDYTIRGQSDFSTLEVWQFADPESVYDFWAKRVQADYAVWFAFSNQLGVESAVVAP